MEGERGVTRSMTADLHSSDIPRDQIAGESGGTRTIIDEIHSSGIQGDQMEGESGVIRSIIDEFHSWDLIKWRVKWVLLEVSLMNFIFRI